jgi:hypothetical protein
MPDKKREAEFTVTDRRKFTQKGDLRPEVSDQPQEEAQPSPSAPADTQAPPAAAEPSAPAPQSPGGKPIPPPPTAAEQQAQKEAFQESSKKLDARLQEELGGGGRVQDFEMSFERFAASLYMTALMQLGLMREQGVPPQVDLLGARQTIDTLGIIADKTKGNLTLAEENLLQNCLYELRVAYVEVTNALAQPPPPGAAPGAIRK